MTRGLTLVTLREAGQLMTETDWENAQWLAALRSDGSSQADAIDKLRSLLLKASRYTLSRYLPERLQDQDVVGNLAEDCAQDALLSVLQHLDEFRGESRFTTWVYKFAVHKALESARREQWKGISLDAQDDSRDVEQARGTGLTLSQDPGASAAQNELWSLIDEVVCHELTDRQRQVVELMVFQDVPMDVVTERLGINRNAVYKLLHDARRGIRRRVEASGYSSEEIMGMFPADMAMVSVRLLQGGCQ